MWYVIQTLAGKENEICIWVNSCVDKRLYKKCFVPLFEDVWRKDGVGNISVKKMFPGYLFVDTDTPEEFYEGLRKIPKKSKLLSIEDKGKRCFTPLYPEEQEFFDNILDDGIMRVSYVHRNKNGKLDRVIGALSDYTDKIVKVDLPHRRAIIEFFMLGRMRQIKFGLWLDTDGKIGWIEQGKAKLGAEPKIKSDVGNFLGYTVGDRVTVTSGIYGDSSLEVSEIRPRRGTVILNVPMFGTIAKVEINADEICRASS
ncbi:transcription termination/antitermination NusG family protein [Pseudobutyrivibrio xylanivorans]|uniref:NusG-like N-terminal domain-containing protein n=1 Tax=Pseudobutyrivibrio xylanivorans TaxID=185007 RepID=A0A5P6VU29_PSEXY|nr:transcription termination/antitermination NusG family protein [Pseudobutyrivibrio xylanivorans]QFJ56097.1 hypothetical protein FXF36_14995 [Pseudobutyrivibrio xylanivorans]